MASEADQVLVENSVRDNRDPVLFSEKKTNFIVDSSSNSGDFSSGQITFDLSTFSSNNWQSLSEAVFEVPLKVTVNMTTASSSNSTVDILSVIPKSSYTSWINSASLIVNGQTIQSQAPYENVAANYRILSQWSNDTLAKWGPACGVYIDDCTAEKNVTYSTSIGLNNAANTVATSVRGYDSVNNGATLTNFGPCGRAVYNNSNIATSTLQNTILGVAGTKASGKNHVAVAAAGTTTGYYYTQFIMATIRLVDLFDINQFPLVKNIKGFIYLNFNSFKTTLTCASNAVSSVQYTPLTGLSSPYTINTGTGGFTIGNGTPVFEVIGTVSGTSANALGSSGPLSTNSRLLIPYYVASPNTDAALTKSSHMFKTLEKIVNPFTMNAGETKNITITVGVQNPTKLLLLPMWQNLGGASISNPEQAVFDTTPVTSGPFAKLDNIQVYVSNKALFQYPVQYDYEYWVQEGIQNGAYSGKVDEISSGLLTKSLWEQNHRYYTFDLSRRLPSDDGMSRSVQLSCTNPSSGYGMRVIAILWYEKQWSINTSTCTVISA
jgi:hypothetical protein